jgi:hypothetical protein
MNATTHLIEHCDAPGCEQGLVKRLDGSVGLCSFCVNGRRIRHTHDAASAIDADPFERAFGAWADLPSPERWARIRDLAAVCRDPANSDAVRALLDEVGR